MTVGTDHLLLLDPSIRDWVVIPMIIMVVLVGIGRQYVQTLLKSTPVIGETELTELRCKQTLQKANALRFNGKFLNEKAFNKRKNNMIRKPDGILREKVPGAANPMSNPSSMIDMMKGNIVFMVPNFVMMAVVGNLFSGFICLKIPFPMLSTHFKLMMQRGVDLSTLDVSYVSSLSWYFMLNFGLSGVYRLMLKDGDFDDMNMVQMQMGMGMGGGMGQPGFDAGAAFKNEREALGYAKHRDVSDLMERKLLGDRYPTAAISAGELDLSGL